MRGAVLHAPHDIRVDDRPDPRIVEPTDAIIRLSATCICGSDLWPYRGIETGDGPAPMGHEYVGIVEDVGADVGNVRPGQFVIGSFFASDNTCAICCSGYQSSCLHREPIGAIGTQAEWARIPLADGTLVATPDLPDDDLIASFLAASDVLGTGWFAAVAAEVAPGKTVAVVGDGAVGLNGAHRVRFAAFFAALVESRLLLAAGTASNLSGDRGARLDACLGAAEIARRMGRPDIVAKAALVMEPTGHPGFDLATRRLCEEALAALERDATALRAEVTARLVETFIFQDVRSVAAQSEEALEVAGRCP